MVMDVWSCPKVSLKRPFFGVSMFYIPKKDPCIGISTYNWASNGSLIVCVSFFFVSVQLSLFLCDEICKA